MNVPIRGLRNPRSVAGAQLARTSACASFTFSVVMFSFLIFALGCSSQVTEKVDAAQESLSIDAKNACEAGQCPCDSPIGSVAHGTTVTVYSSESVGCSESCQKIAQQVKCDNGQFDTDIRDVFFTCRINECSSCSLGNSLIRHGESIETYKTNQVDCNESCEDFKTLRKCENGKLTGDESFSLLSCSARECHCRLPDESGSISLGGKIDFYSAAQASCGSTCSAIKSTRTCTSTGRGPSRTFQLDGSPSFKFQSCQEATQCSCTLPNNLGLLKHGETTTLDQQATAPCGETCPLASRITVSCANGTLKNVATNQTVDPATSPHKFRCVVEQCRACTKSDGTEVPPGASTLFYKTSSPECGVSCSSVGVLRKCNNGVFEGDVSYSQSQCVQRSPCQCPYPDNPTQFIQAHQTQVFYSADRAQCDKACSDLSQERKCVETFVGGNYKYELDGDTSFKFSSCGSAVGCSCELPGSLGVLANGKTTRLTSVEVVPCGKTCDSVDSINVTCQNGVLKNAANGQAVDIAVPGFKYLYFCSFSGCSDCPLKGFGAIQKGAKVRLCSKEKMTCGDQPELFISEFACEGGVLTKNNLPYSSESDPLAPAAWYTDCPLECPGCKTPWGDTVAEGKAVNAYQLMNAVSNTCGRGCKVQKRTCNGGKLDGDDAFNLQACVANNCSQEGGGAPPRVCLLPWQNSYITPDSQIPVWSRRQVPCGDSCQNYFKLAKCDMRTGLFDVGIEFIYQSCTEVCSK